MKKRHVDFIPRYSITGDSRKISEFDKGDLNSIIQALGNLLKTQKGQLADMPELGLYDSIMKIPYGDVMNTSRIVGEIEKQIQKFFQIDIQVTIDENEKIKDEYAISFVIPNLPEIPFRVQFGGSRAKIISPKIVA